MPRESGADNDSSSPFAQRFLMVDEGGRRRGRGRGPGPLSPSPSPCRPGLTRGGRHVAQHQRRVQNSPNGDTARPRHVALLRWPPSNMITMGQPSKPSRLQTALRATHSAELRRPPLPKLSGSGRRRSWWADHANAGRQGEGQGARGPAPRSRPRRRPPSAATRNRCASF